MTGSQGSARRTLLVVEDNEIDFEAAMRAFQRAGLRNPVARCVTGDEALDYLHGRGAFASAPPPTPVLILLDLNLPGTDGREVLSAIKSSALHKKTPVIVLSTSTLLSDVTECYRAGANAYVQKALDPQVFTRSIGRIVDFWLDVAALPAGDR